MQVYANLCNCMRIYAIFLEIVPCYLLHGVPSFTTGKNIAHISPIDVHDCHFFASNNSSVVMYVIRHEHTTIL